MKRWGYITAVLVYMLSMAGCRSLKQEVSRTALALDTVVTITVNTPDAAEAEAALDDCFSELERYEKLFSATLPGSDISRINAAGGAPVTVAPETADLLSLGKKYGELSGGAFDITIRPASALWHFNSEQPVVPDPDQLQEAVRSVDYRKLSVSGTTVTLPEGGLELGGIAKGYIADRLRELLVEKGITSALLDLGGNIVACGSKISGEDWRIGIRDPAKPEELCAVVSGRDISVVTSGIYERGFEKEGVRYHHLLSPKTGMPVQNALASVTIVCRSSVQADALSTACFVLGEEDARKLLETQQGVEALFVHRDGSLSATEGLSYALP